MLETVFGKEWNPYELGTAFEQHMRKPRSDCRSAQSDQGIVSKQEAQKFSRLMFKLLLYNAGIGLGSTFRMNVAFYITQRANDAKNDVVLTSMRRNLRRIDVDTTSFWHHMFTGKLCLFTNRGSSIFFPARDGYRFHSIFRNMDLFWEKSR